MKHNHILKSLLIALTLCLLLGVSALAAEQAPGLEGYNDIENTEYESDITVMQTMGLTLGYADGSYRPGRSYTRLELAQLVAGLLGDEVPEDYEVPYADAREIAGSDAVAAALYQGILSGRSKDSFDPYGSVLKAELMAALENIAEVLGTEDLISKLDDDLALWAEEFSLVTAGEAMHAARAMIAALEPVLGEDDTSAEPASGEPSEEMPAEDAPEAELGETETDTAAEAAESGEEEAIEEETETDEEAPAEPATDASDEPSAEPAQDSASGEPSEEPVAPAEPAAPQGVLAPAATETPVAVTPAPAAQPTAPAAATPAPVTPAAPAEDDGPTVNEDDPFAEMKLQVYAFYADLRNQMAAFFTDLLG